MGTRADFWLGDPAHADPAEREKAEWLGSTAWDGHPGAVFGELTAASAVPDPDDPRRPVCPVGILLVRKDEPVEIAWRRTVAKHLHAQGEGATRTNQGWPWPWPTSRLTDYAYALIDGRVRVAEYGRGWVLDEVLLAHEHDGGDEDATPFDAFPEREHGDFKSMVDVQRVATPGDQRSGLMVMRVPVAFPHELGVVVAVDLAPRTYSSNETSKRRAVAVDLSDPDLVLRQAPNVAEELEEKWARERAAVEASDTEPPEDA